MKNFYEWLTEGAIVAIDTIAQQIQSGQAPVPFVKQRLDQIINALEMEGQENEPHWLHMAATVRDDILPTIRQNPAYRKQADVIEALVSTI